tara:strand:- start:539 stop:997 length:459 start_codon:yes stop_codon:yes gene_type:complete
MNIEEDPEYYKSLSERLQKIIEQHRDRWDEMTQLLLDFRDNIEEERIRGAEEIGLSETQYAFYNILMSEITRQTGDDTLDESTNEEVIEVTKKLVEMMEDASSVVDFFNKQDEIRRVQRNIKRTIDQTSFNSESLRREIMNRFMETARVKFR